MPRVKTKPVAYNVLKASRGENPWERNGSGDDLFRGRHPSLWKFWRHGVTSSFLDRYQDCMEQTRLHYVEGWNSRGNGLGIEFGSGMHWVFERAYGQHFEFLKKKIDNAAALKRYGSEMTSRYEKHWLSIVETPTQKQLEQQEHAYGLMQAMLPTYFRRWDGDFKGGKYTYTNDTTHPVKWHSLEEIFSVNYEFPDGRIVPIRGRRDGLFYDARGDLWVFDTKCRSIVNDQDVLGTMHVDLQQMLYLWVTWKQGIVPKGGIINIPRRPGHRKLKSDSSLQGLLGRAEKEVSLPRNFDHYFFRFQMSITEAEIKDWQATRLDPMMQDVRDWWEGRRPHYPSDTHLISKYGRAAMFTPITRGEFYDCYKRSVPFPELMEVAA
jgi:hypothetical protein